MGIKGSTKKGAAFRCWLSADLLPVFVGDLTLHKKTTKKKGGGWRGEWGDKGGGVQTKGAVAAERQAVRALHGQMT